MCQMVRSGDDVATSERLSLDCPLHISSRFWISPPKKTGHSDQGAHSLHVGTSSAVDVDGSAKM